MPVLRGSRYEGVRFTGILGRDGKVRKFLHAREPLRLENAVEPIVSHPFQRGDQLDDIAFRVAGKPRLWWLLADVNGIAFVLDIEPGASIAVPLPAMQQRQEFGG